MILSENINISDSVIFYSFIRNSLCEILENETVDETLLEFIRKDASNFDVLSLAMYGKKFDVESNALTEEFLLSNLKEFMIENSEIFNTSDYTISDFIHEIGGIGKNSETILQEYDMKDFTSGLKSVVPYWANKWHKNKDNLKWAFNKTMSDYGKKAKDITGRVNSSLNAQQTGPGVGITDEARKAGEKELADRNARQQAAKMAQQTGPGVGITDEARKAGEKAAEESKTLLDRAKELASDASKSISSAWQNFSNAVRNASTTHKTIGAAALIGVAGFLAYKAYQRYFSQAAKSCAGKSGAERTACIANAKKQAVKQQINMLRKSMNGCKAASNPAECKQKINSKIMKLQSKI